MYNILKYNIYLLILWATWSCNNRSSKSLPESMTTDEIVELLPQRDDYLLNEIEKSMIANGLVDIQEINSEIRVDLKYSSLDNFFGENVYGSMQAAYLQPEVALALSQANDSLKSKYPNYRLLVYDAARPLSVQKVLWESLDELPVRERRNYVADPKVGSIHNFGCAVDLSIMDIQTGRPLDMGTSFDFFGYEAYPRMEKQMINEGKLNPIQISNREILRDAMMANGFSPITSEWWHFNYFTRAEAQSKYKIID